MSVRISTYVWAQSEHKGTDLLLLLALADIANDSGDAWPAVRTLATKIRMSERNTQRTLSRLVKTGALTIQANAGPRGCHLYTVQINPSLPLFAEKGDTRVRGDNLTPPDNQGTQGVTSSAKGGDTTTSPEPLRTVSKPSKGIPTFELPTWIPQEAWDGYEAMRKKIKKPMTERARDLVIKKLLILKGDGHNPTAVLEQSERNSWTDVYAIKGDKMPHASQHASINDTDNQLEEKARKLGVSTIGLSKYALVGKINEKMGMH